MACRCPTLPFLPGFTFNTIIGRSNFGKNSIFDRKGDILFMTDKIRSGPGKLHERYPSLYCKGDVSELPGWIAFDKQVLTFDAFFQETLCEVNKSPFQIRKCKFYFFLEDGTLKIVEPKVENSGIPQGTIISRQRVRLPPPKDDLFYDLIDFNIGKEVEIYGKIFKIVNCDRFTRNFLNRLGITVCDPINFPEDPYMINREKMQEALLPKKPNRHIDTFGKFLANDRKVLRFYGYWDDRQTEGGYLHDLIILFYLADDTIEIREIVQDINGKDSSVLLIKRGKLAQLYNEIPTPGYFDMTTTLNVLSSTVTGGRYIIDSLNCGANNTQFYKAKDLAIGAVINVYGRKVILTDCDTFTKEYYRVVFALDDFTPMERPKDEPIIESVPLHKRKLPPWNGFGTFEDSAQNCYTVEPKQIMRDFKKFLKLDRDGMDSRILRFRASMRSSHLDACNRKFIICYYLCDDTISVHEIVGKYSGPTFMRREKMKLPGQEVYTSEVPDYYEAHHMYIGASLNFNGFIFILTDADEYALRYMELNDKQFPKSNINLIVQKLREKLRPIYKDFVAEMLPYEEHKIPYYNFREKICRIMGEDWSEHEMITLARNFSAVCRPQRHTRTFIRQIVLTNLKRLLWDDLDRMKEYFRMWDIQRTGFLSRKEVYTLIKACRLPLDKLVIENMLDVLEKNENCEINGQDLFNFLDNSYFPVPDIEPINVKNELWWASEQDPVAGRLVDWCALTKAIDLEHLFKEPINILEERK